MQRPSALQTVRRICTKAFPQHLVGLADNDKRVGVDGGDGGLDGRNLAALEGTEHHLLPVSAESASPLQQRNPQVHAQQFPGNLFAAAADDIGDLSIDGAVNHRVHGQTGDIHGDDSIKRVVDAAEGHSVQADHNYINSQAQSSDRDMVKLVFQLSQSFQTFLL